MYNRGPYGLEKVLTIDVLVSSFLKKIIQMTCVLVLGNELYPMNEKCSMTFSLESESGLYL